MNKSDNRFTLLPRDVLSIISKRLNEKELGNLKATCRFFDDLFALDLHERITSRLRFETFMENPNIVIFRPSFMPTIPDPWEILKDKRYDLVVRDCCKIIYSEESSKLIDTASKRLERYRPALLPVNKYMFTLVEAICIRIEKGFAAPESLRKTISQFHMNWMFIEESNSDNEDLTSALARQCLWFFEHKILANPNSLPKSYIDKFSYYLFYYRAHKTFSGVFKKKIKDCFQQSPLQEPRNKKQKIDIDHDIEDHKHDKIFTLNK